MKKSILFIITLAFLNACAEYSAFVGPSLTMAKSGSVLQSGTSFATSYGIKQATGQSPGEFVISLAKKNNNTKSLFVKNETKSLFVKNENVRECETIHSSSLSEIFFDTLDIDCLRDPFSILK